MLRRLAPNFFGFTRRKLSSVRRVPRFSETNSQPWSCHFAFVLLSLPRSACTELNSYCKLSSACRLSVWALASSWLSGAFCGAGGGGGDGDAWGVSYPGGGIDIREGAPEVSPAPKHASCDAGN